MQKAGPSFYDDEAVFETYMQHPSGSPVAYGGRPAYSAGLTVSVQIHRTIHLKSQ